MGQFYEVSPGVIFFDSDINTRLLEDEGIEESYNPNHYMIFDSIEFINELQFTEHIKNIIKRCINSKNEKFNIKTDLGPSFDIIRVCFRNVLLILKIPPKSDILNIKRDRIYFSIYMDDEPIYIQQVFDRFKYLEVILRGLLN